MIQLMNLIKGQRKLYEHFFQEANDVFILLNKELNLIEINKSGLTLLKTTRESVMGKNVSLLFHNSLAEGYCYEVLLTGKPFTQDNFTLKLSGPVSFSIKIFSTGEGLGIIMSNISSIKETIDELNTFIYQSSNDMRAPIATIMGLINVAMLEVKDNLALEYIKKIAQQSYVMSHVVRDLLGLVQIRQEEKTITRIDFENLMKEVLLSLQPVSGFDKIRITLHISAEQIFYSDKRLLTTILVNLIDNAIKYRQHNNESYIQILVADSGHGVRIAVEDNGIGIPAVFHSRIFQMFFRASENSKGIGLGLYTVYKCVKKLNGRITMESQEKQGTTFSLTIPDEKAMIVEQ